MGMKHWCLSVGVAAIVAIPASLVEAQQVTDLRAAVREVAPSIVQVIQEHDRAAAQLGNAAVQPTPLPLLVEKYSEPGQKRALFMTTDPNQLTAQMTAGESVLSGVVVSSTGVIMTTLYDGAEGQFEVQTADHQKHKAEVIAFDEVTKCGLLKVNVEGLEWKPVHWSDDELEVGLPVAGIWSQAPGPITVSAGIISTTTFWHESLGVPVVATDANVPPGSSGGAIVSPAGEVVGMVYAATMEKPGSATYFIPAAKLQPLLNHIDAESLTTVKRGLIGLTLVPQTGRVREVHKSSAAAQAGIQADDVVVRVNGLAIHDSSELLCAVCSYRAGDTIELVIRRGDDEQTVSLKLGEFASKSVATIEPQDPSVELPDHLRAIPPQMRDLFRPQLAPDAQLPRIQVERSNLEEEIRQLREDIEGLRKELKAAK